MATSAGIDENKVSTFFNNSYRDIWRHLYLAPFCTWQIKTKSFPVLSFIHWQIGYSLGANFYEAPTVMFL